LSLISIDPDNEPHRAMMLQIGCGDDSWLGDNLGAFVGLKSNGKHSTLDRLGNG